MDGERMTRCWCPKCERFHKMRIIWIGRGVPYKYCRRCKNKYELSGEQIYPDPRESFRESLRAEVC